MKSILSKPEVKQEHRDANRDPITDEPGAHPVGTGLGAASGAVTGALIGSLASPIGTGVGLVAGAIVGGMAGKGLAEGIDPTVEDAYWKTNYLKQKYVASNTPYSVYQPAYRTGYEGRSKYPGKTYEEVETELQRDYENARGDSTLMWEDAKQAARDAWFRI